MTLCIGENVVHGRRWEAWGIVDMDEALRWVFKYVVDPLDSR
jgi:hypothetical protein